MPRRPVFLSQVDDHMLQGYVNAEEGVYTLIGDYTVFGIELSIHKATNRYVVSPTSNVPE